MRNRHRNAVIEAYAAAKELERELAEKQQAKLNEEVSARENFMKNYDLIQEIRKNREQKRSQLMEAARDEVFSTVMKAIYITALEAETLTDDGIILAEDMVDNWIAERGGASKILTPVCNKTYLLSRISQIVDEQAKAIVEDLEAEDIDDDTDIDAVDDEKQEEAEDKSKEFIQGADKEQIKDFMNNLVDAIQDKAEDEGKEQAESDKEVESDETDDVEDDVAMDPDAEEKPAPEETTEDDTTEDIDLDDESDENESEEDNAPAEPDVDEEPAATDTEESETDDLDTEVEDDTEEIESDEEEEDSEDNNDETPEEEVESEDDEDDSDIELDDEEEAEESEEDEDDDEDDEDEFDSEFDLEDEEEEDEEEDEAEDIEDDLEDEDDLGEPLDDDEVDADITIDGDIENTGKVFDDLDKEEDVQKAIDLIRSRVADAEETFIRNNAEDKKKIEELLDKISNNVKTVEDLGEKNPKKAKVAEQAIMESKRAINDITNTRPLTVFERMARIDMSNIVKNESVRVNFLDEETGQLDVDLAVERAKIMYGFLEAVNTLQLEKVDADYIANVLNNMN